MIEQASKIALDHYGIRGQVKSLVGYDDLNFLVVDSEERKYVMKFISGENPLELLLAQDKVLEYLKDDKSLEEAFPTLLKTKDLNTFKRIQTSDGRQYYVRLFSYMEGEFLANVKHTNDLLFDLGQFLAHMDKRLLGINLPAIEVRRLEWDLQYLMDSAKYLPYIEEISKRRIVGYYFLQFKEWIEPKIKHLRKSIVHSDANDWNVLVKDGKVTGILDFGDIAHSQIINELAIAIAYVAMNKDNPLAAACEVTKGYHSIFPLEAEELDVLYYLIASRLCISICKSAYSKTIHPENKYLIISEKSAWDLLEKWIEINPISAENAFKETCDFKPRQPIDHSEFLERRFEHISTSLSIHYDHPVKMEKAALQYMYDDRGNTFLDCVNNICHVGHCHPKVVEAGQKQMALLNTNTRYLYDSLNDYAEKLCATFPEPLNKVFFVNSGSAASDLAIRLAKTYTGCDEIIVVDHGYHGQTQTAIEISPYKFLGKGGKGKAAHTHIAPIPDTYRRLYKTDDPRAGEKYAEEVGSLMDEVKAHGKEIAAFICEPIIGCGGQVVLPPSYLENVYSLVRKHGGVCIVDEVQTGFGRVGSHFWAFEREDVVPDIVILGKPMGNGHPLAAVVTTNEICQSFENGMEFFSSFGGNPVSCAIGMAVLEVIEEEHLQENASKLGNYLMYELTKLKEPYRIIGDVRGAGLFLGIELVKDRGTLEPATEEVDRLINGMRRKGILLSTDGPFKNVIKFKPPLCFSMRNAEQFLYEFENSLKTL